MVRLFIDDKEVTPNTTEKIKVTRCNQRIKDEGDYTFEVELPLSIEANAETFKAWQRLEVNRDNKVFKARLEVDSHVIIDGSAKVTKSDNHSIKLQLYGDKSQTSAVLGDTYIDKLPDMPYILFGIIPGGGNLNSLVITGSNQVMIGNPKTGHVGTPGIALAVPVYDRTNDRVVNRITVKEETDGPRYCIPDGEVIFGLSSMRASWNLLYAVKSVLLHAGIIADLSAYECEPWNLIYITKPTYSLSGALPHWTVTEFISQLEMFFSAHAIVSSSGKTIRFIPKNTAPDTFRIIEPSDDFTMESEDGDAAYKFSNSVKYAIENDEYRVYDYISDDRWEGFNKRSFDTETEMVGAYFNASKDEQRNNIWMCPNGAFTRFDGDDGSFAMTKINSFGNWKGKSQYARELRIVPSPIIDDYEYHWITSGGYHGNTPVYIKMPVVDMDEEAWTQPASTAVQDVIEGWEEDSTQEEASETEDTLGVIFIGEYLNAMRTAPKSAEKVFPDFPIPMGFTDWQYKSEFAVIHEGLSLSLEALHANYAGNGMQIDAQHKYIVSFLCDDVPNADDIYIIKNKRYIAEKIEFEIKDGHIDELMTGYFYEIEG